MEHFSEKLKAAIISGLPGTDAQWVMASSDRLIKDYPRVPGSDAKQAAVLILLFPGSGSVHTVFMQRPDYEGIHSGQISFPGGKMEPTDKSLIMTALREAEEEAGILPSKTEVIGQLTPLFIPVSNMIVTPVVGMYPEVPAFNPDPVEVAELITADLREFLDPSVIRVSQMEIRGELYDIKYFGYRGKIIWGATAMMLNELLEVIRKSGL